MDASSINLERYSKSTEQADGYSTARQREHDCQDKGPLFHGLTITISREAGTQGTAVAREVGQRLSWQVYDHELVDRIAKQTGLRSSDLDSVDEKQANWLMESIAGFSSQPGATESGFVHHLVETVVSLGQEGRCVIVGRGAGFILPATTTFRVRLVGNLDDRIANVIHRLGLTREQAKQWVADRDRERTQFVQSHFSCNVEDPHQYDLLLNTSRWTVTECADIVVQSLRDFEKHPAASRAIRAVAMP